MPPARRTRRSATGNGSRSCVDETRDRPEREIRRLVARDRGLLYGALEQPGEVTGRDLLPWIGRRQQGERLAVAFADRGHRSPQGLGAALRRRNTCQG